MIYSTFFSYIRLSTPRIYQDLCFVRIFIALNKINFKILFSIYMYIQYYYFSATFVQTKTVFWVKVSSQTITGPPTTTSTTSTTPTTTTTTTTTSNTTTSSTTTLTQNGNTDMTSTSSLGITSTLEMTLNSTSAMVSSTMTSTNNAFVNQLTMTLLLLGELHNVL